MTYYIKTLIICLFLISYSLCVTSQVSLSYRDNLAPKTDLHNNIIPLSLTDSEVKSNIAKALIEFISLNSQSLDNTDVKEFYLFFNFVLIRYIR